MVQSKTQLSIYIVGAMLVADFFLFGYWPSRQRLEALQQTQAKQQSLSTLSKIHQRQLPAVKAYLTQCEQTLAHCRNRIPVQRELGSFLQEVSAFMDRNHLADHEIRPGEEYVAQGLMAVPVTVRCRGDLKDLYAFYRQFASIERLVQIEKVRFTRAQDPRRGVQVDARMVIFYRPGTSEGGEPILTEDRL